jgi:hypothetical protein
MYMPFDFIDGLKDKIWTHIDKKWLNRLMKHLNKSQSINIKQIRFISHPVFSAKVPRIGPIVSKT